MKKLLLILALLLPTTPALATTECDLRAETVKALKESYDKGIDKARLLMVFQGSSEYERAIRNIIHSMYRGKVDHLTSDELYEIIYDLCITG